VKLAHEKYIIISLKMTIAIQSMLCSVVLLWIFTCIVYVDAI